MRSPTEIQKARVRDYYARKAHDYSSSYTGRGRYRSNHFRLRIVRALLDGLHVRPSRILEAGCGDARVVAALLEDGYDCIGFDYSPEMIALGRRHLQDGRFDPARISVGDVYEMDFEPASFDVVTCLGVLDILPDHGRIFAEFRKLLRPDGRLIFSSGNELFDLFSANRHTVGYVRGILEAIDLPAPATDRVCRELSALLQVDDAGEVKKIMQRSDIEDEDVKIPSYNPLNLAATMSSHGFALEELRFYHYHPMPPRFETEFPELFGPFAERLETTAYDWRGAILCSALVVQARRL